MKFSPNLNCKYSMDITALIYLVIRLGGDSGNIISIIEQADADEKENINKNIDYLIETSIKCKRHEMTAILIDWKYKNNLHTEKNWEL